MNAAENGVCELKKANAKEALAQAIMGRLFGTARFH
jgi:hypothetical protein